MGASFLTSNFSPTIASHCGENTSDSERDISETNIYDSRWRGGDIMCVVVIAWTGDHFSGADGDFVELILIELLGLVMISWV